jgi:hypothetical protein
VKVYSMKYATPTSLGFVETVFLGIPLRGVPTEVRPASSSNPWRPPLGVMRVAVAVGHEHRHVDGGHSLQQRMIGDATMIIVRLPAQIASPPSGRRALASPSPRGDPL